MHGPKFEGVADELLDVDCGLECDEPDDACGAVDDDGDNAVDYRVDHESYEAERENSIPFFETFSTECARFNFSLFHTKFHEFFQLNTLLVFVS